MALTFHPFHFRRRPCHEDAFFAIAEHQRLEEYSRKGHHSIRINDQWRICFRWDSDGPLKSKSSITINPPTP